MSGRTEALRPPRDLLWILVAYTTGNVASIGFNYAQSIAPSAVVTPVAGSYPALFAILSFWYFREPLHKIEVGGIVLSLIGVIFLISVT